MGNKNLPRLIRIINPVPIVTLVAPKLNVDTRLDACLGQVAAREVVPAVLLIVPVPIATAVFVVVAGELLFLAVVRVDLEL